MRFRDCGFGFRLAAKEVVARAEKVSTHLSEVQISQETFQTLSDALVLMHLSEEPEEELGFRVLGRG